MSWYVTLTDSAALLFSAILEVISDLNKRLLKVRVLRIVWPMWVLFCIILSNGYKGIVVNDLIAPLTQETPKTLDEILENMFRVIYSDPAVTEFQTFHHLLFMANVTTGTQFKGILNKLHMQEVYIPYFIRTITWETTEPALRNDNMLLLLCVNQRTYTNLSNATIHIFLVIEFGTTVWKYSRYCTALQKRFRNFLRRIRSNTIYNRWNGNRLTMLGKF